MPDKIELLEDSDVSQKGKPFERKIVYENKNINAAYQNFINRFLNWNNKPIDQVIIQDINKYLVIRQRELNPYTFDQTKFAMNFLANEIKNLHPVFITDPDQIIQTPEPNRIQNIDIANGIKIRGLSKATGYSYYRKLEEFNDFVNKKSEFDVTIPDIQNFLIYKINQGLCGRTIRTCKNALEFYFREKGIKLDFDQLILPKILPRKLPIVLTKEEITALLEHANRYIHKLLIELAYGSGLRVSELRNVKYVDFNFKELKLKVQWEGAKGKKERFTVLSPIFVDHYLKYLERQGEKYIQAEKNGRPIFNYTARGINLMLKYTALRAGILKDVHSHTLRHSFATHYYIEYRDLYALSKLLGHEHIDTTTIYVATAGEYMDMGKSPLQ